MQIFKTYFKISKKYFFALFLYTAIFLIVIKALTAYEKKTLESAFEPASLNMSVFDHDNSELSSSLISYLSENNELIEIEENIDAFRDNIYQRNVEYILIIPEGFEQKVLSGNDTDLLKSYNLSGSYSSEYADMQINKFINIFGTFILNGQNTDTACINTVNALNTKTNVTITSAANEKNISIPNLYYRYLPYILITIIVLVISPILITFNKPEVRKKSIVSSTSILKFNLCLTAASFVFAFVLFLFFNVFIIIVRHNDMLTMQGLLRILNSFIYMLISLSVAFLFGQILKKSTTVNMCINIISLAMGFICGIFVDRTLLSAPVIAVSRFLPAYWYINVENELANISAASHSTIILGYLIQLLFAVAIFCAGLVIGKVKKN